MDLEANCSRRALEHTRLGRVQEARGNKISARMNSDIVPSIVCNTGGGLCDDVVNGRSYLGRLL